MTKEEVLTENYSSVVRRILLLVGIVMMSVWGFAADAHASKLPRSLSRMSRFPMC